MSGILDLLNSPIGQTLINGASQQLGQGKKQTASALTTALPLIFVLIDPLPSSFYKSSIYITLYVLWV